MTEPVELWRHPSPETTQMWFFKERVEKKYGVMLKDYRELYNWSIENIADFWRETCLFTGVHAKKAGTQGAADASFDQVSDTSPLSRDVECISLFNVSQALDGGKLYENCLCY